MLKNKRFLLILITIALLFVIPSICNAAEVSYTRTFPSNDGTIKINLTGLELSEDKQYEFSLVSKGGTPQKWNLITSYTTSTAEITLSSGTSHIISILKVTDSGQIFIREKDNTESYVVNRLNVDLTLPYLQSLVYSIDGNDYQCNKLLYGSIGNQYANLLDADHTYVQWKKVTDQKFIEEFLNVKSNNEDIATLEKYLPSCPTSGYNPDRTPSYKNKNDGLYLLWVKRTGENCKDVYSCIIHDGLPEATKVSEYIEGLDVEKPVVNSISVISPTSGTYLTNQTVKISVKFSENITGSTVPTLKVRFGESQERTVTNGTISGDAIVYSYNIAETDKGQLAVTGFEGGTIKDAAGNDAVISLKTLGGNTIKANIEGNQNNQTPNQDQTTTVTLTAISITKAPTKVSYTEGEKFDKTGMVITATYSDGTTKNITNYTISPSETLKTTDKKVTITYTENGVIKTAEQVIKVNSKTSGVTLSSIKITKAPSKTKYTEGEKFNKNGMIITATYSDGTTKEITNYSVSPSKELKTTDKKVTIAYTENEVTKTVQQTISVEKDSTTKKDDKIPQTGVAVLSVALISLTAVAVISKIKYGAYKDI